ncbi:hypothetical protein IG631_22835 [Alternaria alternata]|nr:hypothetical protein IG631_22835 [Alternaria alternata]
MNTVHQVTRHHMIRYPCKLLVLRCTFSKTQPPNFPSRVSAVSKPLRVTFREAPRGSAFFDADHRISALAPHAPSACTPQHPSRDMLLAISRMYCALHVPCGLDIAKAGHVVYD